MMAYDSGRGFAVLFGGSDTNGPFNDTWEWDGTNWRERAPSQNPPPRASASMTYDSARGVTVLFGGGNSSNYVNDTWEWDGTDWNQRSPTRSPPARYSATMAYDSARSVSVLFGGEGATGVLSDTWEWNGIEWSQVSPPLSPSVGIAAAMAYDSGRAVCVLLGANADTHFFDGETWEWDGANWGQRFPPVTPKGWNSSSLVYDSARRESMLFGGRLEYGYSGENDTWIWAGPSLALPTSCKGVPSGSPSGVYQLVSGEVVYCDMVTDGGGWTLVLAVDHPAGGLTRVAFGQTPTDPDRGYSVMDPANVEALHFSEARFYCTGDNEVGGPVHFKTSNVGAVTYAFGGASQNQASFWTSGYTLLPGAGSPLPQNVDQVFADTTAPLEDYPFFDSNVAAWSIDVYSNVTSGYLFNCSSASNDELHNQLFQVWGR
jgi:hypothetical protein